MPKNRDRNQIHKHPNYYAIRNHLIDFLVSMMLDTDSELLPADRQLPTLLRKITLAGQQTGITFTLFRPSAMQPSDYHTEMPINVAVSGDYHAVGSFLAELSNMRRIVTVTNLKLTTNTKPDGTGTTIAEFTASAYSLNTSPAGASAGTKKGDANGRKS